MSAAASAWALEVRAGSPTKKLVLLALADRHNKDTGRCDPSMKCLIADTELSENAVRNALSSLESDGLIQKQARTRENGSCRSNSYLLLHPTLLLVGGTPLVVGGDPAPGAPLEPELEPELEPKDLPPLTPPPSQAITIAWRGCSPPLIEHREAYFRCAAVSRAINHALSVYPPEAIVQAIENYATVLFGSAYRWDHRWTLAEFLKRGLDRFVPEADPIRNFRIKGEKYGRRDVSGAEFRALADRLKAERLEGRELASG